MASSSFILSLESTPIAFLGLQNCRPIFSSLSNQPNKQQARCFSRLPSSRKTCALHPDKPTSLQDDGFVASPVKTAPQRFHLRLREISRRKPAIKEFSRRSLAREVGDIQNRMKGKGNWKKRLSPEGFRNVLLWLANPTKVMPDLLRLLNGTLPAIEVEGAPSSARTTLRLATNHTNHPV